MVKLMADEALFTISDRYGVLHDILPAVQEVLKDNPYGVVMDQDVLARLTVKRYSGKYISVSELVGYPRQDIDEMISRVCRWSVDENQGQSFDDPDVRRLRPYLELSTSDGACDLAVQKSQAFLGLTEVERLPLNGCWSRCLCRYRTLTDRDLLRRKELAEKQTN